MEAPHSLKSNEMAEVVFQPQQPLVVTSQATKRLHAGSADGRAMVAQQEQRAAHDPTKGRPCAAAPAVPPRPAWLTRSQPTGERLTYLRAVPIVFDDRRRSSLTAAPRVDKSSGASACVGSSRANPTENERLLLQSKRVATTYHEPRDPPRKTLAGSMLVG